MRSLVVATAILALIPALDGQEILHYKFESGGGTTEINYGTADPSIPRLANVVKASSAPIGQSWGPGRFGTGFGVGATPGSSYELDTGWDNVMGTATDLTVALFFKVAHPLPANDFFDLCRPASGGDGIRLSIMTIAGQFGWARLDWQSGHGNHSYSNLMQDVLTPAYTDWVHLAFTVTRTPQGGSYSAVVRWYINGVAQIPQVPGGSWTNALGSSLQTLRVAQRNDGYFHLDEFRLGLRTASAGEIAQWAMQNHAAQTAFGDACHPFGVLALLDGGPGGLPVIGNGSYALDVHSLPGSSVYLVLGLSNTSAGGLPLPFDLGSVAPSLAGCHQRVSADLGILPGLVGADGRAHFPIPIPAVPALSGVSVYSQALLHSPVLGTLMLTNAYASSLGS